MYNPLGNKFIGKWNKFTVTNEYKSRTEVVLNCAPWQEFKSFYSNLQEVNVLQIHSSTLISALPQWKTQFFSKSKLLEVNFLHHVTHNSEFIITSFIVHESGWPNSLEKYFLNGISSWKSISWCLSRLWTGLWFLDKYVLYTHAVLGIWDTSSYQLWEFPLMLVSHLVCRAWSSRSPFKLYLYSWDPLSNHSQMNLLS